jgi:hypothetical protein
VDKEKRFLLYLATGILCFCALYFCLVTFVPIPTTGQKYADIILGALIGSAFTGILSFYFGSSKSSRDMGEQRAKLDEIKETKVLLETKRGPGVLATILAIIMVGCMGVAAHAAPFLICDPPAATDTKPAYYVVTGAAWIPAQVPAQADGSIRLDVVQASTGITNLVVKACVNDPAWGGEVCSPTVPFVLARPSGPIKPAGLKISP